MEHAVLGAGLLPPSPKLKGRPIDAANDILTARSWSILQGDCVDVLRTLPAGCINSCVTSPPYWALRSYLPKDHADKPLELGSEPTPDEYVARLVGVFDEVRRVMRDDAVLWVNLGDSYGSGTTGGCSPSSTLTGSGGRYRTGSKNESMYQQSTSPVKTGLKPLDLCLIPERFALAMQASGWYVRARIAWCKPSAMPESLGGVRWERCRVKVGNREPEKTEYLMMTPDREPGYNHHKVAIWQPCPGCPKCEKTGGLVLRRGAWRPTRSWEYIFMFTKSAAYYCDPEAVRTILAEATVQRDRYTRILDDPDEQFAVKHNHETVSTGGANLRDVVNFGAEPCSMCMCPQCGRIYLDAEARQERRRLKRQGCLTCGFQPFKDFLAHYAQFPTQLPYLCLKASMSAHGYCPTCGGPWARVIERGELIKTGASGNLRPSDDKYAGLEGTCLAARQNQVPTCTCPPHDPVPGLALDPFAGSGRTVLAALKLGHRGMGIELHPGYCAMARAMIEEYQNENATPLFGGK